MAAAPGQQRLWSWALHFEGPSQSSGQTWGLVSDMSRFISYVTLNKLLDFFEPQFPHLNNGNDDSYYEYHMK